MFLKYEPNMSKKYFCPGGMALSESTRSLRADSDTPVEDYSALDLNTTRRIAYRPSIAVSPFLLALSVFYYKRTLWNCGQLWLYIEMYSLGTHFHRNCNGIGDIAKISPCVSSSCAQNAIPSLLIIHIIPSRQIYVAINNPSLMLSISCLTASYYIWNSESAANDDSHAENLQSNSCQCISHLYKFRDWIQVTWVLRCCAECQG